MTSSLPESGRKWTEVVKTNTSSVQKAHGRLLQSCKDSSIQLLGTCVIILKREATTPLVPVTDTASFVNKE